MFPTWPLALSAEQLSNTLLFGLVLFAVEESAKIGDTKPEQIRRDRIALVVGDDLIDSACLPQIQYIGSSDVHFSRDPTGYGQFV